MLYMVHMQVNVPDTLPKAEADRLKDQEKAYAQKLQHDGTWRHLWRIAGKYANYSVFDAAGNDELHDILSSLPLYPYMTISVTPLAQHPSAIAAN